MCVSPFFINYFIKMRKWDGGKNINKMGPILSSYLTLKALVKRQHKLIKKLILEIGFLKSELDEANDMKEMWRTKYLDKINNDGSKI